MALGVCCVTYLFFASTCSKLTNRFTQKSRSCLSLNTLAVDNKICRRELGLSTYIQYECLYGSKSMNMLITMAPKCGTPHPCGQVVNPDGLLKWHLLFFPLQSFFHSTHHSSVWKDWVLQANRLIVSNCWQFFLTVQLHPPICLSIQVFLEFLNWISCVIWYFIFAWNNVQICVILMFCICVISHFTFYLQWIQLGLWTGFQESYFLEGLESRGGWKILCALRSGVIVITGLECRWWFFPATGLAAHMGGIA